MKFLIFSCLICIATNAMDEVTHVEKDITQENVITFVGRNAQNKPIVAAIFMPGAPYNIDMYESYGNKEKFGRDSLLIYEALENLHKNQEESKKNAILKK